jgi:DNA-binding NtrC family response regulator
VQDIKDKILVVDDEESIRNLVQRILQSAGYEVEAAVNGKDALNKVQESDIDVMILDMNMPVMSGMETLQQATDRWPDICVIMVTAINDTDTAVEAMKHGAYDYITKPFDRHDLIQKVQKAIDRRNLLAEEESATDKLGSNWPTGLSANDWIAKEDKE